ncbi:MAG: phosphoadenylyl-sulfate reductase [Fimbriimonadaceae bacterium]|nr:phosphoadenylyl-sulfate reductase [Alphaproteobacteria bacterium]
MISYELIKQQYGHLAGAELLEVLIRDVFPGRIALVSSFGAETAILAHMVAQIDPATPLVMIDTGKLFPETLAYRDALIEKLGLTNVIVGKPDTETLAERDADGSLHEQDHDACCALRKTEPLEKALRGYQSWITGRKRNHSDTRSTLETLETADWRLKVNPLAHWTRDDVNAYFAAHDLPRHPLVAQNYLSIGCAPCTTPVNEGEDPRAGRWRTSEKTECGIHWTHNGKPLRGGEARSA